LRVRPPNNGAVRELLPELQEQLADIVTRARPVQHAAEALAEGERAEYNRRRQVMSEINIALESYRRPPAKAE
jgi:hypothetical protein